MTSYMHLIPALQAIAAFPSGPHTRPRRHDIANNRNNIQLEKHPQFQVSEWAKPFPCFWDWFNCKPEPIHKSWDNGEVNKLFERGHSWMRSSLSMVFFCGKYSTMICKLHLQTANFLKRKEFILRKNSFATRFIQSGQGLRWSISHEGIEWSWIIETTTSSHLGQRRKKWNQFTATQE